MSESEIARLRFQEEARLKNHFPKQAKNSNLQSHKKLKNKNRGVAQLVARLLWEQDAAGSNPVTRTNLPRSLIQVAGNFNSFHDVRLQP